jgi:hypothetical protein
VLLGAHDLRETDLPSAAVAAVSETPWPDAYASGHERARPILEDIGPRAAAIREDDLVLVDGDRGVLLANPTDRALAAFQAHTTGIAPTRRLYLDYSHQPVRLPDGRRIRVSAVVGSARLASSAIESGPDALYTASGCDAQGIRETARASHGKPVTFAVHPEGCCGAALVEGAAQGDITAVLMVGSALGAVAAFREELERAAAALVTDGRDTGRVRVGVCATEDVTGPAAVLEAGVERLVVDACSGRLTGSWLEATLEAARSVLVPVEVALPGGRYDLAPNVLEQSVNGVIVPPEHVQPWKEALREAVATAWVQ